MTRKHLIIGVAAILCAAGIYALYRKRSGPAAEDAGVATIVPVETGTLRLATVHGFVDGYGSVMPAPADANQAPAAAKVQSQIAGMVAKTFVTEGQAVEKGAPLFDLDSRYAKIAVERVGKAAQYARANAERQKRLFSEQNTSAKALQDAEAQAAAAEADLAAAENQLTWVHIAAPLGGVVTHVNVRPGESVDLTTVLAEVADLSRLVVEADIPSAEAVGVKAGQAVQVLTSPAVNATLTYTSPSVDRSNDTVTVRASLPAGSGLRLGQFVSLRIATSEHANVLVAPAESVVTNADGGSVIAIVEGDEATQHAVTTGLREDNLVEVSGKDVKAGQTVVTVGAYGLPEKTKVKVAGGGNAAPGAKEP